MGQLFYEGQEVTPIGKDWTAFVGPGISGPLPKFGDIYHVDSYGYHDDFPGRWLIRLKELGQNDWYFQECFAPVMPDDAIAELMKETITEEIGTPV